MLLLKLLQNLPLPRLLRINPRSTGLLLPLLNHHLLHHLPRLSIQVAEFRRLRRNLSDVDCRRGSHHVRPPVHLVDFVEVDGDFFARGCACCFESPGGFVRMDGVWEGSLLPSAYFSHINPEGSILGRY